MIDPLTLIAFSIAAFIGATAATMMGFGIGTSLTPIFALVYSTHIAVMLVAIVHFLSNLFRLLLFRRHVDRGLVRRFGILSILGAFVGSMTQGLIQSDWLKVALGVLLVILGSVELLPHTSVWHFPRRLDQIGGFISGLIGGFLGNQGAIRGAYLVNYDIPKEAFIATAAVIAIFIDSTRIPIYLYTQWPEVARNWLLLLVVSIAAYAGTYLGQGLVGKVSQASFRRLVNGMILAFGILLITQGSWQISSSVAITAIATLAVPLLAVIPVWLFRRSTRAGATMGGPTP